MKDPMAQLPMPSWQATSSTPFVSTDTRSAAGGRGQEEGHLAKGIGGQFSDIMGVGAEQRWSPGGKQDGSMCGRVKRLG